MSPSNRLRSRLYAAFAAAAMAVSPLLMSCSHDDTYSIDAEARGLGTQNLRLVYIADDAVHTAQTTALDDRFRFEGRLERPVAMDIYNNSGALLARMLVSPGEHVSMKLDINDYGASVIEGSEATGRLIAFLADNRKSADINGAIAAYVGDHRDDPVSALLMTSYYDIDASTPATADSLLQLVDARARSVVGVESYATLLSQAMADRTRRLPARLRLRTADADSMVGIPTRGHRRMLLAIQDIDSRPELKRQAEAVADRLDARDISMVEVTLASDSLQWRLTLTADTVPGRWTHAYTPAGVMDLSLKPLAVTKLPCYIVADSTGRYIVRTDDPAKAMRALTDK